jgi:RND family efflux transporter MFP subunit
MRFFRALALSFICSQSVHAATLVTIEDADGLLINPTRSSPAAVIALNQGNVPAQTSGVVTKLLVNVGDKVNKGETLATLDCVSNLFTQKVEAARFSQTQTQLLFNKRELKRGNKLVKQRNIGEAELDRLESGVETSRSLLNAQKAVLDMAATNVERCSIKSPYNGVVTKRIASVGEMIDFGKPVVEMLETDQLEVSAKIATSDELSFQEAKQYILDIAGEEYSVSLKSVLPVIETNARSREARFIFNKNQALAGSTGRLRWQSPLSYLPAHLLQKRNGKSGYFIVESTAGKDAAKFIAVASAEEGRPVLFDGATNTKVVTDGRHSLHDGDEVEITKAKANRSGDKS